MLSGFFTFAAFMMEKIIKNFRNPPTQVYFLRTNKKKTQIFPNEYFRAIEEWS